MCSLRGAPTKLSATLVGHSPRTSSGNPGGQRGLAGEALRTLAVARRWLPADALAEHAAHPDQRVEQNLVFVGAHRHDRSAPPRGARRCRPRERRRDSSAHDHRRPSPHGRRDRSGTRHYGRRTRHQRRGIRDIDIRRQRSARCDEVSVYARVNPEHKLRIVDALRGPAP